MAYDHHENEHPHNNNNNIIIVIFVRPAHDTAVQAYLKHNLISKSLPHRCKHNVQS